MASNYSLAVTETGDRVVVHVQADDDVQPTANVTINEINVTMTANVTINERDGF